MTRTIIVLSLGLVACSPTFKKSAPENVEKSEVALSDLKLVYFPLGNCETAKIEVQVNGQMHASFPMIDAGACIRMKQADIQNTFSRCVEPGGPRVPSAWTGPPVTTGFGSSLCQEILN